MLAKKRQERILTLLHSAGAVTTADLVQRLQVSAETVRRDLLTMEQRGLLSRVHGGAVAHGSMKQYGDLQQRNREYSQEKQALSCAAAELVTEGDIIAVDAGSTAISFATALKERFRNLTVITHSQDVFEALREHAQFRVILCGGEYLKQERAFYGVLTMDAYGKLHARKAFLFPSAVSLTNGICDFQTELYPIQRLLTKSADRIFILADSSKFEKQALLKIDDMRSDYTYVTDNALSEELHRLYSDNNIQIITADTPKKQQEEKS